jgi:hypothetical protein
MHKSATKCNETVGKWCKNKHGASKIIDTLEMYQTSLRRRKVKDQIRQMHILDEYRIWQFLNKGRHQRRHKVGADNAKTNWWDYTRIHSTIASGATTIGSAQHAPNEVIAKLFRVEVWGWSTLYLSLYSKKVLFDYSFGGYSHRERWARTRWCLLTSTGAWKAKEYEMKHWYSHREWVFMVV